MKTIRQIDKEIKHLVGKKNEKNLKGWIITIVILVILFLLFTLPIFPKSSKQSYQEIVNRDNCDNSYGCVCTSKGGFLWLTCKQCSCTQYKTVTEYVPLVRLLSDKE